MISRMRPVAKRWMSPGIRRPISPVIRRMSPVIRRPISPVIRRMISSVLMCLGIYVISCCIFGDYLFNVSLSLSVLYSYARLIQSRLYSA